MTNEERSDIILQLIYSDGGGDRRRAKKIETALDEAEQRGIDAAVHLLQGRELAWKDSRGSAGKYRHIEAMINANLVRDDALKEYEKFLKKRSLNGN